MTPVEKDHGRGWNAAIARQLRAERAASGMTVDQLVEKSGVPKRTLMRLLNEQRGIDVAHLASLAEALGLNVNELVERAEARVSDGELSDEAPNLGAVASKGEIEEPGENF